MKRAALAMSVVALLSLGLAAPVLAAAPANDGHAGRTLIGAIPFTDALDTSDATTDADDDEVNAQCFAPALEASVWYEVTAVADGGIVVDVSASSYPAAVLIAVGSPGGFVVVACGPGIVGITTTAGQTYSILVFDFEEGVGNGGLLDMTVEELPPPPTIELSIDRTGSFDPWTGIATIRGTVTCSGSEDLNKINVQMTQTVGRFKFLGEGGAEMGACTGKPQAWSAEVSSSAGKFGGGKASVAVHFFLCNLAGCTEDGSERVVTLRK